MFQSQIRDLERVQKDIDANNMRKPNYALFIQSIKEHDYSFMMSDDDRTWNKGTKEVKQIEVLIFKLINDDKFNAPYLQSVALREVPQQYNDKNENGDDLTHRVIKGWFKEYINK